jgi:hypothetical protein
MPSHVLEGAAVVVTGWRDTQIWAGLPSCGNGGLKGEVTAAGIAASSTSAGDPRAIRSAGCEMWL